MAKRKHEKAGKKKGSAKQKGEVVERIVAMMHEQEPQITVRRDVQLPAKHSGKRSRQIDVLLLGHFAGHPTTLAVECKNLKRPVDVGHVGQFRDLLEDVGLYPNQDILVSASGIGSGALSRARQLGIKAYELAGLTPDRLAEAIHEASQLVIFIVPFISHLTVLEKESGPEKGNAELLILFDTNEKAVAWLPDLVWLKWLEGEPPSVLGDHELQLDIPKGWHTRANDRPVGILSAYATVKVVAAVVAFPGTASGFAMIDPEDESLHRFHSTASFEHAPGEYPVHTFDDEVELEAFLEGRQEAVKVTVGRIRTPRMQLQHIFWPPSARVVRRISQYLKFHQAGRIGRLRPEDLRDIEGTDLSPLWEPIAEDYPALKLLRQEG